MDRGAGTEPEAQGWAGTEVGGPGGPCPEAFTLKTMFKQCAGQTTHLVGGMQPVGRQFETSGGAERICEPEFETWPPPTPRAPALSRWAPWMFRLASGADAPSLSDPNPTGPSECGLRDAQLDNLLMGSVPACFLPLLVGSLLPLGPPQHQIGVAGYTQYQIDLGLGGIVHTVPGTQ